MANQEKELSKFVNDPEYRVRVIEKAHQKADKQYERRIKSLRNEKDDLISDRKRTISKIEKQRWESFADGKLLINTTEYKVKINGGEFRFSDILGAEPLLQGTYRVVTESDGKAKKHASLGGALGGAILTGNAFGALVGGVSLGKTTMSGTSVQDSIPVYSRIGVRVNINGIISEITLLSKQVEQSSKECQEALRDSQTILTKLAEISSIPVSDTYLKVEEEPIVLGYDKLIVDKEKEIEAAIMDTPVYEIPAMYRTVEQKDMTDDEYLVYLANEDALRASVTEEPVTIDEPKPKQRSSSRGSAFKTILRVIAHIIGWMTCGNTLLLGAITMFEFDLISLLMFIASAVIVNPLFYRFLKSKLSFVRWWMVIPAYIVTFFTAFMFFGASLATDAEQASSAVASIISILNI